MRILNHKMLDYNTYHRQTPNLEPASIYSNEDRSHFEANNVFSISDTDHLNGSHRSDAVSN
jgi:hypothetical protein